MRNPKALVIQHAPNAGAARVGEWLADAGVELDVVHPYLDPNSLPEDLSGHDAVLTLGGVQSAYDPEDKFPWGPRTLGLLRSAVEHRVPTLGICLGGQLLAQANGGRVERGRHGPELGARLVAKRDISVQDPLFADLPLTPDVIAWHFDDIVELPPGAVLLASSVTYPNHAFRLGECAWGTQFHFETTPDMVREWAENTRRAAERRGIDIDAELAHAIEVHEDLDFAWRPFTERFAALVFRRTRESAGAAGE